LPGHLLTQSPAWAESKSREPWQAVADIGDLMPFDDGVCDFITAVCVYHYVPVERRATLTAGALRVLKPGARFASLNTIPGIQ
jgi:SAM-dependent methyltransferase